MQLEQRALPRQMEIPYVTPGVGSVAMGLSEGLEVFFADEMLCGAPHRLHIEVSTHVPGRLVPERISRCLVEHTIGVVFSDAVPFCIKPIGHALRRDDGEVVGQLTPQRQDELVIRNAGANPARDHLAAGMHARIRATRAAQKLRLARYRPHGVEEDLMHAPPPGVGLPTQKISAVVSHFQAPCDEGLLSHSRTVRQPAHSCNTELPAQFALLGQGAERSRTASHPRRSRMREPSTSPREPGHLSIRRRLRYPGAMLRLPSAIRGATWALFGLLFTGCVSTEYQGREILRVGPLRGVSLVPSQVDDTVPELRAGSDVLNDDEFSSLRDRLPVFWRAIWRDRAPPPPDSQGLGSARIERCVLRAGPGRRQTVYEARCRVSFRAEHVTLVEVEVVARRIRPPKAVSASQAETNRQQQRNPLLAFEDSEEVVRAALTHAAAWLAAGSPDTGPDAPAARPTPPTPPDDAIRRLALQSLQSETKRHRVAAIIDLARYGRHEDGARLLPFLHDREREVRRATAATLAELLPREAYDALVRACDDREPWVAGFARTGILRMRAVYPDLRAVPIPGPCASKSSTAGTGSSATM